MYTILFNWSESNIAVGWGHGVVASNGSESSDDVGAILIWRPTGKLSGPQAAVNGDPVQRLGMARGTA